MPKRGRPGPKNPDDTRRRIVEATVALHEEVGPAATTIRAIAERAGVQRLTVYRHFPDAAAVIGACSAHWSALHPFPDPTEWWAEMDPRRRLARALESTYGYYLAGAPMLARLLADVGRVAPLAEAMRPFFELLEQLAARLAEGWPPEPERQRRVRALVGHALRFGTWRSLADEGLDAAEAAALMACAVAAAADGCGEGAG